eukprot:Platyproteum_vivax@DN442_c0_g1_i1.p1
MDSDEEFEFESDGDFNDNEDGDNEENILIENTFYEADDQKLSNMDAALRQFKKVVDLEGNRSPADQQWTFKSLQNIVILSAKLGRESEMVEYYERLLGLMEFVTRNEATEAINTVLDSFVIGDCLTHIEKAYTMTLSKLKTSQNDRLYFNTSIKLARVYLEAKATNKLTELLQQLRQTCELSGEDDPAKGSQLLELYSLEIQMCQMTNNSKRMKEIYPKTVNLTSAIADPRNVAIIRENGGKMYMKDRKWAEAYNEFFEAFKNYQETGSTRAKEVLKLVVLANMLAVSDINPFDSREAKVYEADTEIRNMSELRNAMDKKDPQRIDHVLKKSRLLEDPFVAGHLEDLLRNIRLQIIQALVVPYTKVSISYLCQELSLEEDQLVSLLVRLILEKKLVARIDYIKGFVEMQESYFRAEARLDTLRRLVAVVKRISLVVGRQVHNITQPPNMY